MSDSDPYTWENYGRYCQMLLTEHPGLIPSTYEQWVAFNKVMAVGWAGAGLMGKSRCRHTWDKWLWQKIGPAPDFRGQPCELWKCSSCGDERSVFVGVGEQLGWGGRIGVEGEADT